MRGGGVVLNMNGFAASSSCGFPLGSLMSYGIALFVCVLDLLVFMDILMCTCKILCYAGCIVFAILLFLMGSAHLI